jgi:hypothetical protein
MGADRQAEAGAAETPGGRAVGLLEGQEEAGDFVRAHADPGVADPKVQHVAVDAGLQRDVAVVCELDGVAQQVDEHLREAQRVALATGRQAVFADFEVEPAGEGSFGGEGDGAVDDLARFDGDLLDRQLAGLDLRAVEEVVDDAEQVLAGVDDAPELLVGLPSGEVALADLGKPEHGVERCADFVAHVGDEFAARAGQPFGFGAGFGAGGGEGLFNLPPLAHFEHDDEEDDKGHGAGGRQEEGWNGVGFEFALGDQADEGRGGSPRCLA